MIRDVIEKYGLKNGDRWIRSDNAPSLYKNKHTFRFYQNIAKEFGLHIIRTYGASGQGKGIIDVMSSFGANPICYIIITTQDVFLNNSISIVDCLSIKKPQSSHRNVSTCELTAKRLNDQHSPLEIRDDYFYTTQMK